MARLWTAAANRSRLRESLRDMLWTRFFVFFAVLIRSLQIFSGQLGWELIFSSQLPRAGTLS